MAVILPFEEQLWRRAGHDAVYVGHPSTEALPLPDLEGAAPRAPALAVLPGSRPGEIARLAAPLLEAAAMLLASGAAASARVVAAPGMAPPARARLERLAAAASLPIVEADPERGAAPLLPGFAAALCASGTASLEAALAGAAPVVAYRLDPLAFAIARRLVRTPHIALPNVLLGRRAYPELLQDDVTAPRLAACARALLEQREASIRLAAELHAALAPPSAAPFGRRVAELLLPWLG
jgi:lipid-A-disaccharide synthase